MDGPIGGNYIVLSLHNWQLYPRWSEFTEARKALDPDGHFTNSYLERVLGY